MTRQVPVAEEITPTGKGAGVTPGARVLDWTEVERRLNQGGWRWLATVRPDGAPHVMPVFGVWSESAVFVVSKDTAQKPQPRRGWAVCPYRRRGWGASDRRGRGEPSAR